LRQAGNGEQCADERGREEDFSHGAMIGAMRESVNCSSEKRIA
jgi:hypothetical protein